MSANFDMAHGTLMVCALHPTSSITFDVLEHFLDFLVTYIPDFLKYIVKGESYLEEQFCQIAHYLVEHLIQTNGILL